MCKKRYELKMIELKSKSARKEKAKEIEYQKELNEAKRLELKILKTKAALKANDEVNN